MTFAEQILVTLIGSIAPIAAVFVAWRSTEKATKEAAAATQDNTAAIHEIRISINGRINELIEAKGASKRAEGVEVGRAEGAEAAESVRSEVVEAVQAVKAEVVETLKQELPRAISSDTLKDMKTLLLLVAMTALVLQR